MTCAISILPFLSWADGVQVSGGVDGRYSYESRSEEDEAVLQGVFLNLRKVWRDEAGDRWIGVAQVDADDNFDDVSPYQVYLQYKGPLGRWNIRAGHFLLPFGLLATYDTERLLLQGLEETSLGIRKDTGLEVLGFAGDFDYAVSLTDGLGDEEFLDSRAAPLLTARLAYVRDEWQLGLSVLAGRVLVDTESSAEDDTVQQRRLGVDLTRFVGPLTLRTEVVGGEENGKSVGGGVVLADYALTPKAELNTRYSVWDDTQTEQSAGVGVTYQLRPWLFIRVADEYEFQDDENTVTGQIYMEFSRAL